MLFVLLQATRDIAFNVSQLYAAAANSSLAGFTTGRAGDPLVVVAALRSALGRPVFTADNVRVTVTGKLLSNALNAMCLMCDTFDKHPPTAATHWPQHQVAWL